MDLNVFRDDELPHALRALRDVVASNGTVTPAEYRFLEVVAELHGARVDASALAGVDLAELARVIQKPHQRKRVVQMALIAALVEGEPTEAETAAVKRLATALQVDDAGLKVIEDIAAEHHFLTRFDMLRRIMGPVASRAYEEEGLSGLKRMSVLFTRGGDEPEVAWKYKQLGLLPEGTLGREFWKHCTSRRFGFPGESGGIPERLVFHDFGHILAGYDTDPAGEIQQGAFQAGFIRKDGFAFLLFVVIQFHLGIKVTPVAEAETGLFDAGKVLKAAARGAASKVDLSDHWDPFAVAHLPLEQVREQYGIPPL